jgi:hypothetical protein
MEVGILGNCLPAGRQGMLGYWVIGAIRSRDIGNLSSTSKFDIQHSAFDIHL